MRDSVFTNASGKMEDGTSNRNSVLIRGMKKQTEISSNAWKNGWEAS